MRRISNFLCLILLISGTTDAFGQHATNNETLYLQNRAPLRPNPYLSLPLGAIEPRGWLKVQLVRQKNGMTGNLDKLYPLMGERNGWLGGDGDQWERGPYWIDGLLPLAYILDDKSLIKKVQPWIEWTLQSQQKDGYFGPVTPEGGFEREPGLQKDNAEDWWPKMVMLKVLQQYYSATGDERVIELMTNYFKYQLENLPETPLGHWTYWGQRRGGDNLLVVYWLYNITGDEFLLKLGDLLHAQTHDWTNSFLHTDDLSSFYRYHGVNLAMGVKAPLIYYQRHPEAQYSQAVQTAFAKIRKYHGQPQGMYGADELTHGKSPLRGAELCSIVELMYSLENIMAIKPDVAYMDHLEKIAFNALPTQATDDYSMRQYYQQPNQVMISRYNRIFFTPHEGTDQCFGVLTGYPCCTANMHQGWPKYVQNLWLATRDKGLAALVYGASEVTAKVADGSEVTFTEETSYPFEDRIRFTYKGKDGLLFPLHVRIPGWCRKAKITINGETWMEPVGDQIVKINRKWHDGDKVVLELPMHLFVSRWYQNAVAVERGPLVYALKMEEDWEKVENDDHFGDFWEVYPNSPWNYGLLEKSVYNPEAAFTVTVKNGDISEYPWNPDNAPVVIKTKAKRIPEWQLYGEGAGPLPYSTIRYLKDEPEEEITLIPYGCTTLRISEFPLVE